MYSKKITDSDAFIEMASSAQALYFHLNQGADDDGFNNQIQNAMFKAHASIDDLKVLMAKNFILRFESGVIVIKHWLIHNTLRKDRYTPTNFQEELRLLGIKDNNAYTLNKEESARLPDGCQMVAKRLPNGCQTVAADKIREEEIREDKIIKEKSIEKKSVRFTPPSIEEVRTYCLERKNGINAEQFIDFYTSKGWKIGKETMKDWKAAVRTWERRDGRRGANGVLLSNERDDILDGIL